MLKDITLGQYFPGDTIVHRLDPRTKLILTILYIVLLFIAKSFVSYGIVLLFLVICILLSRIRLKAILSGLKPLVILIIITGLLNLFYTRGEHLLLRVWRISYRRRSRRRSGYRSNQKMVRTG